MQHLPSLQRFHKRTKTWRRITEYPKLLTKDQVDATIAQAFQLYSDVIPLDFKQVNNGIADFKIRFVTREHGDSRPFDGPGGDLAHAYPPGQDASGQVHFDDDEGWSVSRKGVNLLLVAAHEFGHALGLDHVNDKTSLMYSGYQYVDTNGYKLPEDDKLGVQALYGSRTPLSISEPRPSSPPGTDPEPELEL